MLQASECENNIIHVTYCKFPRKILQQFAMLYVENVQQIRSIALHKMDRSNNVYRNSVYGRVSVKVSHVRHLKLYCKFP